jgi:hypothetical protein
LAVMLSFPLDPLIWPEPLPPVIVVAIESSLHCCAETTAGRTKAS